jgi:hypothetical protein
MKMNEDDIVSKMDDDYCCGAKKPIGFTYYQNVTVCNTCLTQFPYYDCYCELSHENCNYQTRHRNAEARAVWIPHE